LYKIEVSSLEFETIIGILPQERVNKQRVIVEFCGEYEMQDDDFINYVDIKDTIINNMNTKEFELIETALDDTIDAISNKYQTLKNIYLKISKPDILQDCIVSVSKSI
jgi:dihydroneopterin aldolase